MATAQQFEVLGVWQDARQMVREVYQIANQRAFRRDFSLRGQIIRAATSMMSNIAEGFERGSLKEFIQFLHIAKGSNARFAPSFTWRWIWHTSTRKLSTP